jgi:hypothetical protein
MLFALGETFAAHVKKPNYNFLINKHRRILFMPGLSRMGE